MTSVRQQLYELLPSGRAETPPCQREKSAMINSGKCGGLQRQAATAAGRGSHIHGGQARAPRNPLSIARERGREKKGSVRLAANSSFCISPTSLPVFLSAPGPPGEEGTRNFFPHHPNYRPSVIPNQKQPPVVGRLQQQRHLHRFPVPRPVSTLPSTVQGQERKRPIRGLGTGKQRGCSQPCGHNQDLGREGEGIRARHARGLSLLPRSPHSSAGLPPRCHGEVQPPPHAAAAATIAAAAAISAAYFAAEARQASSLACLFLPSVKSSATSWQRSRLLQMRVQSGLRSAISTHGTPPARPNSFRRVLTAEGARGGAAAAETALCAD
uniref:Uncharacterized protein n=1 Tax=Sphaerodactylus townsendi TaxID=933632 RepID=A0ACB8FNY3_9SAUR